MSAMTPEAAAARRRKWEWIQQHAPKLGEFLVAMKAAGMPAVEVRLRDPRTGREIRP